MCTILTLLPEQSIDFVKLNNAIANNLDGFGLILSDRDEKTLEVIREYNPAGTDTDKVARLLEDNKGVTRHLHLRNNTKGENSLDNTHPFSVFSAGGRDVLLMHNGTFAHEFCPKGEDKRSDTRVFGEDFLSPLLYRFTGEFGLGDYNDPILKTIISRFVGGVNRVALISNDLEPLYLGNWVEISNQDGTKFKASNNDYFNYISRGPRKPPFLAQTHHHMPHNGNRGTMNTGVGTNVVPIHNQPQGVAPSDTTFRDLEDGKTFVEKSAEAAGQTNAAPSTAKSHPIVPLSSIDHEKDEYNPSNAFLLSLGSSRRMYDDFGLGAIAWISDQEIATALKSSHASDVADLIRALVEYAEEASEDKDVSDQYLERYKRDHEALEETVEMLIKDNEKLTLALADRDDHEETNRSLSLDNRLLLTQNKQMAFEMEYLRKVLNAANIEVPSSDAIRSINKVEKQEIAA